MDDSQNSDIFSETSASRLNITIEIEKYATLVSKIKASAVLRERINVLIDDCRSHILLSHDLIHILLEDENTEIDKLCKYLDDAVSTMQILSNCIKTNIESVVTTISAVKNFSTCTGDIILSVFTHCKDSEFIYGNHLCKVEKQLKDLFRNCHELQLTYLRTLEKHLIFDLTEKEHQDILVETLEINLKIGDVVQSLDVKTMAEQWKAYTMICEKYSSFLRDKNIFSASLDLLASTIERNITTALEAPEEDKMVLRSLKVANFTLKILLRICNIFKCSISNNYENIIKLLLHLSLCNSSYHEVAANKSSEFTALVDTHISEPSEMLIAALVNEDNFLKLILLTKSSELKESALLGYMLLIIMIMKALLQKKDVSTHIADKVIDCVFSLLPYCHKWFNISLKLKHTKEGRTYYYGLYEHLLLHTVALTTTFSCRQYKRLEKYLYEALLGTEYYSAIFASNLWVLLCRLSNNQVQLDVLLGLINVYQRLEPNALFLTSPQRIYLSYTIEKLFQTLHYNEKMQIYKQFSVKDEKNFGIWSAMKLRNLHNVPFVKDVVCDLYSKLNEDLKDNEDALEDLIKHLKLASTCAFVERDSRVEDLLSRAWLKACPLCNGVSQTLLSDRSMWLFRYLEGLASLTESYMDKFEQRTSLVKILNIISNILQIRNVETVHLLFKLFCKLSNSLIENQNDKEIATLLTNTIWYLSQGNDDFQQHIFSIVVSHDDISGITIPVFKDSKDTWTKFIDYKNIMNTQEWHKQIEIAADNKCIHKCIETTVDVQEHKYMEINDDINELRKSKSNFDVGDLDSLFDESDGEEPASKKAKLDFDVDNLIAKIESDVEQLCQSKENITSEYKGRINGICDKLKNIVS